MSQIYTQKELAAFYKQLEPWNKRKVSEYVEHLVFIQEAENNAEETVNQIRYGAIQAALDGNGKLHCSFCGRAEGENEVKIVAAADNTGAVCFDCIDILAEVKRDDLKKTKR